jgi:3-deoxy-manno-octulosonate cytidylyltransferase (CMP-KDO synthetase)
MILDLCGLPVILRTYEAVKATGLFDEVIVVTDSKKIATLTEGHGALTILSQKDHETGSDRIAEAAESIQADIIINVQGDEPFIESESLRALIDCFREDHQQLIDLASLMVAITDQTAINNPNVVKVVTDLTGKALYFSRSAIPFHRDPGPGARCYKHKGVYAFRRSALLAFPKLIMGPLERAEKIEAIRYLEHGKRLQMIETSVDAPGIDTRADLEDAIANFKTLNS